MSMVVPQDSAPFPPAGVWPALSSPLALTGAVFLVALAWSFAVHLPLLHNESGDDANFAWISHQWMHGTLPYLGAFDIKPPGLFALLGVSELAFGPTLEAARALTVVTDATTATGLFFLARRFGGAQVGAFAAAIYPVMSLLAVAYDAVSWLSAFTVLAFLAALSELSPIRRAALAGLLIGAAATVKQSAAFEAMALAWIVTSAPNALGRRGRTWLAFAVGAAAAPLGFLIYFALHGATGSLIENAVVDALRRPGSELEGISFLDGLGRFLLLQKGVLPLGPICICAVLRRRELQAAAPGLPLNALFAWLAAACAAVILQRSLYPQYLAPTLAPALLIAGFWAARDLTKLIHARSVGCLMALAALTLISALRTGAAEYARSNSQDSSLLQRTAEAIRASGPQPTDRLYVVNRGLWLNSILDLAPPTKYIFPTHALCAFYDAGAKAVEENLAAQPRYILVADRRLRFGCEKPERWPPIDDALKRSYRLLAHVAGERDAYDVYEWIDAPAFAGWGLRP